MGTVGESQPPELEDGLALFIDLVTLGLADSVAVRLITWRTTFVIEVDWFWFRSLALLSFAGIQGVSLLAAKHDAVADILMCGLELLGEGLRVEDSAFAKRG